MESYEGDYPQQQQGQRGRQSDPSRMDPMTGQPEQQGQGQGQQGQWGQTQGQQGQWGQGQPQGPGTYGYGRDDDFSPPAEQGTAGEGEYGSRSGLGYGSSATGARGAASDYDTSQYQAQQQQQPSQQQMPQQGAGGEQHKPGMGQKLMGKAEKAFGKMTGDKEKAQKSQERESGQRY